MPTTNKEKHIIDYSQEMSFALVPMLEDRLVFCGVAGESFFKLPKYYTTSVDYAPVKDDGEHIVKMMEQVVDKFQQQLLQNHIIVRRTLHNLWPEICSFVIEGNRATFQIEYHDELFK